MAPVLLLSFLPALLEALLLFALAPLAVAGLALLAERLALLSSSSSPTGDGPRSRSRSARTRCRRQSRGWTIWRRRSAPIPVRRSVRRSSRWSSWAYRSMRGKPAAGPTSCRSGSWAHRRAERKPSKRLRLRVVHRHCEGGIEIAGFGKDGGTREGMLENAGRCKAIRDDVKMVVHLGF